MTAWSWVAWALTVAATYIIVLAGLDAVDQWQTRRRPVRGSDGRWRAPRRADRGWGPRR